MSVAYLIRVPQICHPPDCYCCSFVALEPVVGGQVVEAKRPIGLKDMLQVMYCDLKSLRVVEQKALENMASCCFLKKDNLLEHYY